MTELCVGCVHWKVVKFDTPDSPDGVPCRFEDRCFRFDTNRDGIGWSCLAETSTDPSFAWSNRCGPDRKHFQARESE